MRPNENEGEGGLFTSRALGVVTATMLCAAALPAAALTLGEPEIRSYLGEPLDARIPIGGADAGAAEADCFAIVPGDGKGIPALAGAVLAVEPAGNGRTVLRVRSKSPLHEPVMLMRVRASCPGQAGRLLRDYPMLLDPAPLQVPAVERVVLAQAGSLPPAGVEREAATSTPSAAPHRKRSRAHAAGEEASRAHVRPKQRQATSRTRTNGFALKLSGPEIELGALHDDRKRAEMRELRLVLDLDDQTASLLATQERVRQLEAHLHALELKLAAMPPAIATIATDGRAASVAPPAPTAATPEAAAPRRVREVAASSLGAAMPSLAMGLIGLLFAAVAAWGLWRARRDVRRLRAFRESMPEDAAVTEPTLHEPAIAAHAPPVPPHSGERVHGGVALEDSAAVVRAARVHYESGAVLRAVQVLEAAIDAHPEHAGPWLALLELVRREGLVDEYDRLARRFRAARGEGVEWRKVQFLGRELDPGNALYHDAAAEALDFDPATENWLDLRASFDEALGEELRQFVNDVPVVSASPAPPAPPKFVYHPEPDAARHSRAA